MLLSELKIGSSPELIAKVLYAERIASLLEIPSSSLVAEMFPNIAELSEANINSIVSGIKPTIIINEVNAADILRVEESVKKAFKDRSLDLIGTYEASIRTLISSALSRYREGDNYLSRANEAKLNLEEAKKNIEKAGKGSIAWVKDLLSNSFFTLSSVSEYEIKLATKEVTMTSKIEENNYSVNFGTFTLIISLPTKRIKLKSNKNNLFVNDYYHTYVSNSGDICWGTGKEVVVKAIIEDNWKLVLDYLVSLLTNYSTDSTPYVDLLEFNKKQNIKLGLAEAETKDCGCDEENDCDCVRCISCENYTAEEDNCNECERCNDCGHTSGCDLN